MQLKEVSNLALSQVPQEEQGSARLGPGSVLTGGLLPGSPLARGQHTSMVNRSLTYRLQLGSFSRTRITPLILINVNDGG